MDTRGGTEEGLGGGGRFVVAIEPVVVTCVLLPAVLVTLMRSVSGGSAAGLPGGGAGEVDVLTGIRPDSAGVAGRTVDAI